MPWLHLYGRPFGKSLGSRWITSCGSEKTKHLSSANGFLQKSRHTLSIQRDRSLRDLKREREWEAEEVYYVQLDLGPDGGTGEAAILTRSALCSAWRDLDARLHYRLLSFPLLPHPAPMSLDKAGFGLWGRTRPESIACSNKGCRNTLNIDAKDWQEWSTFLARSELPELLGVSSPVQSHEHQLLQRLRLSFFLSFLDVCSLSLVSIFWGVK